MKYELSHDVLALKAYERASAEDKTLRKVERLIKERHAFYKQRRTLLRQDDLDYIRPYLQEVAISEEEEAFIERSKRSIKRRSQLLTVIILGIILLLLGLAAYALNQSSTARIEKENAQNEKENAIKASELATKNAQIAKEKELEAERERDNALAAQIQADNNARLAEAREKEANLERYLSEKARDEAERARTEAEEARIKSEVNAEIARVKEEEAQAQKRNADQNARKANALRILALAQSLMAIADQIEDPILKAKLVNQAYEFHMRQEGDLFDPVIHNGLRSALVAANWGNSVKKHQSAIMGMAFSNDGNHLYSTARDGKLIKWKWGEKLDSVNAARLKNPLITQGGLSLNEEWLAASGDRASELEVFKLSDFPQAYPLKMTINQPINDLVFNPKDNQQLILATSNGLMYQDVEITRANPFAFIFPETSTHKLAVGSSGRWVAGLNQKGEIEIGASKQQRISSNFNQIKNVQAIAFSKSEKFFAAGDRSGKVSLYDFSNGELLATLRGHTARISQVSFYEDNSQTFLVSVGYDGKAQLWYWNSQETEKVREQLSTRLPIVLKIDEKWEFSLAFSPEGKHILIGNRSGVIQQWLIHIDDMAELLRQKVPDLDLSEEERKQYLKGVDNN